MIHIFVTDVMKNSLSVINTKYIHYLVWFIGIYSKVLFSCFDAGGGGLENNLELHSKGLGVRVI